MSIVKAFFDSLFETPKGFESPKSDAPPPTNFVDFLRERSTLMMERDCYKALLLQSGHTERSLRDRVVMYVRQVKAAVRAS